MYAHSHIHVNSLPRTFIHFFSTRTQQRLIITGTDPSNEIIYLLMRHLRSMSVYIRWLVGGGIHCYVGL